MRSDPECRTWELEGARLDLWQYFQWKGPTNGRYGDIASRPMRTAGIGIKANSGHGDQGAPIPETASVPSDGLCNKTGVAYAHHKYP